MRRQRTHASLKGVSEQKQYCALVANKGQMNGHYDETVAMMKCTMVTSDMFWIAPAEKGTAVVTACVLMYSHRNGVASQVGSFLTGLITRNQ